MKQTKERERRTTISAPYNSGFHLSPAGHFKLSRASLSLSLSSPSPRSVSSPSSSTSVPTPYSPLHRAASRRGRRTEREAMGDGVVRWGQVWGMWCGGGKGVPHGDALPPAAVRLGGEGEASRAPGSAPPNPRMGTAVGRGV